jgi:hypothetical protein
MELNPTKECCLASECDAQSYLRLCYLHDKYERWLCEGRDVNNDVFKYKPDLFKSNVSCPNQQVKLYFNIINKKG